MCVDVCTRTETRFYFAWWRRRSRRGVSERMSEWVGSVVGGGCVRGDAILTTETGGGEKTASQTTNQHRR